MTVSITHPSMSRSFDSVFRDRPWIDSRWDETTRQFMSTVAGNLATKLPSMAPAVAAAHAYADACVSHALPPTSQETYARMTLTLVTRELLKQAENPDVPQAELAALASEFAVSAPAVPEDASTTFKLAAVERVVSTARKALLEARNRTPADHPARAFVAPCYDQLSHALSLFMARGTSAESVVRGAILRADGMAQKVRTPGWNQANAATRRAIAKRALADVAAALVTVIPDASLGPPDNREACLWLARTAGRILACSAKVDEWISDGPEVSQEAVATTTNTATTPNHGATMANTNSTVTASSKQTNKPEPPKISPPTITESKGKEPQSVVRTLQSDATEAAWRLAGSQFVKLAREPLVGLLSRHLAPDDESMRAKIAAFLQTEIGTAMLAALLSAGLSAMPMNAGKVPDRLARELRVRAMADAGDVLADVLMGPLRQVISLYLRDVGTEVNTNTSTPAELTEGGQTSTVNTTVSNTERETIPR